MATRIDRKALQKQIADLMRSYLGHHPEQQFSIALDYTALVASRCNIKLLRSWIADVERLEASVKDAPLVMPVAGPMPGDTPQRKTRKSRK